MMRIHIPLQLALVALLVSLALPAPVWGAGAVLPHNPLQGKGLFTSKRCIACHSIQGIGGKAGPDLGDVRLGSVTSSIGNLWNHFPKMIETFEQEDLQWPTLTAEDARALFTFIYFLNFFDKASNPELGKRLFLEKSCIRCHSVGGNGGDVGPKLDSFQKHYAAPYITAALWNSGPEMIVKMRERNIPRPQFREGDVLDILAFIRASGRSVETERRYLPPADPVNGRTVFEKKNCIRCHAVRGKGGKIGPDLSRSDLKRTLSKILSELWNHGSNMWPRMEKEGIPFPEFTPEEMSDLLAYLYFIRFGEEPGSPVRGAAVFAEKKCKSCHVSERPGVEPIGPNLADAGLDSLFDIIAQLWNHAPAIGEKMQRENIRWPILEKDEMRDLIAYILSLR